MRRRTAPPNPAPTAGGAPPGLHHLANLLVETGAISEDQARIARTEQRNTGAGFADAAAKLGFVTEGIIRDALGGALGVESVDLGSAVAEADATATVPERVARRFLAVGLAHRARCGGRAAADHRRDGGPVRRDRARPSAFAVRGGRGGRPRSSPAAPTWSGSSSAPTDTNLSVSGISRGNRVRGGRRPSRPGGLRRRPAGPGNTASPSSGSWTCCCPTP